MMYYLIVIKFIIYLGKKIAVIDLEQTLIHSVVNPQDYKIFDDVIETEIEMKKIKIGIRIRPYLKEALQEISKNYVLVVFSHKKKIYSDILINYIDPDNTIFKLRLYRENCIKIETADGEKFYVKDLRIFESIPTSRIIIIDKSVISFAFQIDNGIPILPYTDSKTDNELKILVSYLNHLSLFDDIKEENRKVFGLENLLNSSSNNFNENDENYDSSGLYSYRTDSGRNDKADSDKEKYIPLARINKIEKIEPIRINNLQRNVIKNNFNSNSSYESNSLLSCVILLNKGQLNYDSACKDNTHTFISSDCSKSDSEQDRRFV